MFTTAAALLMLASVRIDLPAPPPAGRVIVEFTRGGGGSVERLRRDIPMLGKRALDPVRHEYRHAMSGAALDVPPETVDALRHLPYVRAVYPDLTVHAFGAQSADAAAHVNAVSLPARGEGMVVAVIDTGIDYRHETLGGGFGPGHKVAGGWDFVNGDADPLDDNGHGTHVAGIIAADSAGFSGVAPAATLYAYKVLDPLGSGLQSDIIAAIERGIDPNQDGDPSDHVDVINLSLGGRGTADDPTSRAVDQATAAGITVVVAAGNEGAPLTVRSPGTARTAITVGAVTDSGAMTTFSSRGPAPALLTFKPDVVAPGFEVLSAQLGGGLVRYSGTSMAAPYVAGVAALLLELHPDWTPADVRSALVTTAVPTADPPAARGAGRVDAERAAAVRTLLDSSGLSFGLAPGAAGTWEERRLVTVTNRAAVARTIEIAAAIVPPGATLTATPPALQLAPGASQTVELALRIDNAALDFPDQPVLSGVIEFRGEEPFQLPWIVMRAARLTVSLDIFTPHFLGVSAAGVKGVVPYDYRNAELFGRPGTTWDIFAPGLEPGDVLGPVLRLVLAENRLMEGDTRLALSGASASAELVLDAWDETGRPLVDSERERHGTNRLHTLILKYDKGFRELFTFGGSQSKTFITPTAMRIHLFQMSADLQGERAYNIQYPVLDGVAESKTLTVRAADYVHTVVHFKDEGRAPYTLSACATNGVRSGAALDLHSQSCITEVLDAPPSVRYYTTTESADGGSGIMFHLIGTTIVPPLRGIGGGLVATELAPSPVDYRIADGEEIVVGGPPMFPIAFFGTTNAVRYQWVWSGFHGPFNEWYTGATHGATWTVYDPQNVPRSSGWVQLLDPGPSALPGDRLVAVREGLQVAGVSGRGELEVQFGGDGNDLVPPTLTSLRLEDALGRVAGRLPRNSGAVLRFSAADHDYEADAQTGPLRTEATRVWYRPSGSGPWRPLPVLLDGSDTGSFATIRHIPAGDLYRVDLASATAAVGLVDLRIEVEDLRGNRTSWTQTPAFLVTEPKRRSVR